ncbi:MutS-related protein [Desmospora activa]|uniref:MutS-like protein n=1 Tax=Desmospora activa DSM 45169 TaxID=1121389 RepID=A0A2T4Z4L8_9BACL|nr:hypothetical protein [Desmospora activa]PTM56839.1 MutS-like protein [Desmospora activa DSM 45169]
MPWMDEQSQQALLWPQVWARFQPLTPMGQRAKKELSPFQPGDEDAWERCIQEQERCLKRAEQDPDWEVRLEENLTSIPDAEAVVAELERESVPSLLGWFRLKGLIWYGRQVIAAWPEEVAVGVDSEMQTWEDVLRIFNPELIRKPSFALNDAFDPRLADIRQEVAACERKRVEVREERAGAIEQKYGVKRNHAGEWIVERGNAVYEGLMADPQVEKVRDSPFEGVFSLLTTEEERNVLVQRQQAEEELEQVEQEVLSTLARRIRPYLSWLQRVLQEVVWIDLQWARVRLARKWNGVPPQLDRDVFHLKGAVHPAVVASLEQKGAAFTPVDVTVKKGTTVVIGPNMGGKTIALKTVGVVAALGQFGFFVPARSCGMPLFPWIRTVIGDGQDERDGLSTFGAEVKRLTEAIQQADAGLLLLDEVGRGTNPVEGSALATAVTEMLAISSIWSLQATHFSEVVEVGGIHIYRTAGLRNPQAWNAEDGPMEVDYRLLPGAGEGVPRQALIIAEALGFPRPILEKAQRRLKSRDSEQVEPSSDPLSIDTETVETPYD